MELYGEPGNLRLFRMQVCLVMLLYQIIKRKYDAAVSDHKEKVCTEKECIMNEYSLRVELCADGVYRWSYHMNMWRNRFLLNKILHIVWLHMLAFGATVAWLTGGMQGEYVMAVMIVLACELIGTAVVILIYAIAAILRGGDHQLCFDMDEDGVALVYSGIEKKIVDTFGGVAVSARSASGKSVSNPTYRKMAEGSGGVGYSPYEKIVSVKAHPRYDVIDLSMVNGGNQIYVCKEDYELVKNYILEHKESAQKR